MRHARRTGLIAICCLATALAGASPASAHRVTGGAQTSDATLPRITSLRCEDGERFACETGRELTVVGDRLHGVRAVVFLGGPGRQDDRGARPVSSRTHRITVTVPSKAQAGPVRVLARVAKTTQRSRVSRRLTLPAFPALTTSPVSTESVFPIQGKHTYGALAPNLFGGRHQGQDVFADCGTPLVAAAAGKVDTATFQSAAGNYVVIDLPDGSSQAYMHLQAPAKVKVGDTVAAGESLGEVGATGRASGCHLHFETWTSPGWYSGGRPVDPTPYLKSVESDAPATGDAPTAARRASAAR